MPYFLIDAFKSGLDVRKSPITAPAGTLTHLENAVITPGGEILKRKAFVKVASVPGTFGLASLGNKLVVFTKNTTPANPGLKDPQGVVPDDVTLEYHRLPNTSNTSILTDYDVFDGKLYVVLHDPQPNNKTPVGTGATLPRGVPEGEVYRLTSDNNIDYVWRKGAWEMWEADSSGQTNPERAMPGDTFHNTKDNKIYVRTSTNQWADWHPDGEVATLPTTYQNGDVWHNTTDNLNYAWREKEWVPVNPPEFKVNTAYAVNDFVLKDGKIYKALKAVPAQPSFISTDWQYLGISASVKGTNPHYYYDDRDKINDKLVVDVNDTWEWTTKTNPNYGTYQETEGSGMGYYVRAYKSKMYCVGDKYLRFSAVDNAYLWEASTNPNDTSRTGAGYINVSLQEGGSAQLNGVEIYYDKLALMTEYSCQMWAVVSDPKQNTLGQILRQTGTKAPWSVQQYGSGDILYLASSGIRSLKARDLSNSAAVSDIGSPIDDWIRQIPKKERTMCRSVLEPIVGRVWFAFRRTIAVLSFFPGPSVTAWSTFKTDWDIEYIENCGDRLFVRSGDDIYLYGGVDKETYDDTVATVTLPYLDGGKPGHMKQFQAFDVTAEGDWDVAVSYDFDDTTAEEPVAAITGATWNKGRHELTGYGSHVSLRFTSTGDGKALISNAAIHYQLATDSD